MTVDRASSSRNLFFYSRSFFHGIRNSWLSIGCEQTELDLPYSYPYPGGSYLPFSKIASRETADQKSPSTSTKRTLVRGGELRMASLNRSVTSGD